MTSKRKTKQVARLSPPLKRVVKMLRRPSGASRKQLEEALPDSKPAYIGAILYRILAAKGHKVRSARTEGSREVTYKLD